MLSYQTTHIHAHDYKMMSSMTPYMFTKAVITQQKTEQQFSGFNV